jgi:hypothetical protein
MRLLMLIILVIVALLIIDVAVFDSRYSAQITEAVERGLNKLR